MKEGGGWVPIGNKKALESQKKTKVEEREDKCDCTCFARAPAVAAPAVPSDRELTASFYPSSLCQTHSLLSRDGNWCLKVCYS